MRFLVPVLIVFMCAAGYAQESAGWQVQNVPDPLHGRAVTAITLAGKFLTAPSGASFPQPILVVKCLDGKVIEDYLSFGAVLDTHPEHIYPLMLEARLDGKKTDLAADGVSTDYTSAYMPRVELRRIIRAHSVIIGAYQYLGPEIVAEFDVPPSDPVLAACGRDRILKRR